MSLKAQAVTGVKWNGGTMIIVTILNFVTLAFLARLLDPSDFGLMGMILIVIRFAQIFEDIGLSNAIIHRQNVTENQLSSFFWINILMGFVIFICIQLIAPLADYYFKQPNLSNYLIYAAFLFLITPIRQIFNTLLMKELDFKTLSKVNITSSFVYSLAAISLAIAKFGVLSLILGELIRSIFNVIILFFYFRKTWLPRFHFSIKEIQNYFSFGAFQLGERVLNYISANIDYIIIGRFLGPAVLGFYTLAYQIIIFPLMKINPIITRVAFPTFSKIQNDDSKMRRGYCKVVNYITMVSFPMLAGMIVVAPEFIRLVFGANWEPSVIILQILCLVGAIRSLGNPIGSVLLSKGRADIGFYWNLFTVIIIAIGVFIGVNWGIVGVAFAILIVQIPLFIIIQPIVNKLIHLKFSQYLKAIQSPFICSLIMLTGIIPLKISLGDINMILLITFIVTTGIIIYISSYFMKDKATFFELKSMYK